MNSHYTYSLILAASFIGPLVLSFDKKVAFYQSFKYLLPAIIIPAGLYILWDIYFTSKGVWSFNENYITGIKLINLPIEEVLFFFIVPYCCVFIYECIRYYFPLLKKRKSANIILKLIGIVLFIIGIVFYKRYYTSYTFILCAVFIAMVYWCKNYFLNFDASIFLVSFLIILIPFLIVNGFLTAIPIVMYNDAENLGIRIYTIPFEDTFYGMLLVMMNVAVFERIRNKAQINYPA